MSNLLSVREAAAFLNVGVPTLRRWLAEKRLAYIKLGGRVLLDPADLQAAIDRARVPATGVQKAA